MKLKILFVDDESDLFPFFQSVADELKLEGIFATDGNQALEICDRHKSEIVMIVSDLKMPNHDGFELKKTLNSKHEDIPFILSSGYITKDLALVALDLGIKSIINKPYEVEELVSLIAEKSASRIEDLKEEYEMKVEFQADAKSLLLEVEDNLIEFEASPSSLNHVNTIMRLLHTIKGTAACLGFTQLSQFTHHYEDFWGPISRGEIIADHHFVSSALKALDTLSYLINNLLDLSLLDFDVTDAAKIFDVQEKQQISPNSKNAPQEVVESKGTSVDQSQNQKSDEINVSTALLDEFMEQSGELTVLKSMIVKQVQSLEREYGQSESLERLVESLEEMNHVSGSIQNKIVELRKVPLRNILRQLPRVARDTCRATGKDVHLELVGQNLRIDQSIGDALQNVLVHMIRNAIDHGIEDNETRQQRNKNTKGLVTVTCEENADHVIVVVSDDGGGIVPEKIRSIALKKELYSEDQLNRMSDQRVQEIIFEPGFSTSETVTDISGRGVGMDMVYSTVKAMGGQLVLNSSVGKGSHMELIFPVPKSVLIIKALFIRIGKEIFSINQESIEKVILIEKKNQKNIQKISDQYFLAFDKTLIPIVDLANKFSIDVSNQLSFQNLVVLKADGNLFAVPVCEILENDEIVVKNIDENLKKLKVFTGATFLGDGRVVLVLNAPGILDYLEIDIEQKQLNRVGTSSESATPKTMDQYLILKGFDDDNAAIPLTDIYRLETCQKKDIQYIHNQMIIRYLNTPMPIFSYFGSLNIDQLPEEFQIIVHRWKNDPVGFAIKKVLDIHAPDSPLDETIKTEYIKGSVLIKGHTTQIIDPKSISIDKLKADYFETSVESGQDKYAV